MQSRSFASKFFTIGGILCILFVILMCVLLEKARDPECYISTNAAAQWFVPHININDRDLPPPLVAQVQEVNVGPFIQIKNPSGHPLYWLAPDRNQDASRQPFYSKVVGVPLPPGFTVSSKVVSDTVFYLDVLYGPDNFQWKESSENAIFINWAGFFEDRNQHGGNRLGDVVLPEQQTKDVLFLYDTSFLTMTATLTYSLNADYVPNVRNLPTCDSFPDMQFGLLVFPVMAFYCVAIYVASIAVYAVMRLLLGLWRARRE